MLLQLHIENYILIDKLSIKFNEGFSVLTGETGAGKSIVIDAIGLLLGDRATRECVRRDEEIAVIEGMFDIFNKSDIKKLLKLNGIPDEDTLIISREIHSNGRSVCRLNSRLVSLTTLKEIASSLVDIHGQHENQSILNSDKHIDFVDMLGSSDINELLLKVKNKYKYLDDLNCKLNNISLDEKEKERKLDLLKYQYEEIDNANLKLDEDKYVLERYKLLFNTEEIVKTITNVNEILNESEYNENSVMDSLNFVYKNLNYLTKYDDIHKDYSERVQAVIYQIQDVYRELRLYSEKLEYNPEEVKLLEERLDTINKLKRKYGETIETILEFKENVKSEMDYLSKCEHEIENLKKDIDITEKKLDKLCNDLTLIRKKISEKFEIQIANELKELNMGNIKFKVDFEKLNYYTEKGNDKIEFLISTNIGEPLKSLTKIVSGGEMSRIMLAFKSIIAEKDNTSSLIFDEIDSGISGRTAQVVGEKIAKLSKKHQVLCITHLPQIAAMGDTHFLIRKNVTNNKTITDVIKLEKNDKINEMARLLGGVSLTDITLKHAEETLELAKKYKNCI